MMSVAVVAVFIVAMFFLGSVLGAGAYELTLLAGGPPWLGVVMSFVVPGLFGWFVVGPVAATYLRGVL